MDDFRKELSEVKQELKLVEEQIEQLLQRQAVLLERKKDIEGVLTQSTSKPKHGDENWNRSDFSWSAELKETMVSVYRMRSLRPMQLETMNLTMSNKDCILIMPTGGGKSLCFQLPALISKGITLVVSPLVSLMEDQVIALRDYNVDASMLNAACDKETVKRVQDAMIDKKATLKLLYVTPEKLAKSKRFMARLEKMYQLGRFSRLVIDEVHCCSQWGHDFRPDYKFLGIMKRQFPEVPILGLTATATLKVLDDVKKILNIPNCYLFRASFNRPNLYYEVRPKPSSQADTMNDMKQLIHSKFRDQSGIVYCLTRKDSEEVTTALQQRGVKAGCYHADLSARERSRVHRDWLQNKILVVVATVAFGMGIDKPDVRFVIHHSLSKSMENLYQESGRAGRDEGRSHCIVYYKFADVFRLSTMVFTEQTGQENLYGIVRYCTDIKRCRRSVIARHFGEVWDKSQCNNMCDHCDAHCGGSEKRDVTRHCQNVMKILDLAKSTEQRLTALKLLETWMGKGVQTLRIKGAEAPSIAREKLERIIAHMLLEGYIEESFHFTPYSTISYLVPGSKAQLLSSSIGTVSMDFPSKQNSTNSPKTTSQPVKQPPSSTAGSKSFSPSKKSSKEKPKLCVINRENSAFKSTFPLPLDSGIGSEGNIQSKPQRKKRTKTTAMIESEDDDDSLDFGDFDVSISKKRTLRHKKDDGQSHSQVKHQSVEKGDNPLVIDSDENNSGGSCYQGSAGSNSPANKNGYRIDDGNVNQIVSIDIDSDSDTR